MNGIVVLIIFVAAVTILLLVAWWMDDPTRFSPSRSREDNGLETWFQISCAVAVVAGLLLVGLFVSALHWEWLAGRVGGVLAPLGAAVAAALASAGAARTLLAQSTIAGQNRHEDAERLLWERFQKGAEELSDKHYAIRAAGVYGLAGLADDWIRHHERAKVIMGQEASKRSVSAECETIVEILCAYLRSNRHLYPELDQIKRNEEAIVNEAIMTQIASHFRLSENADDNPDRLGLWARRKIVMDLRGADLSGVYFRQVDLKGAVLSRANLYDADLTGADLSDAKLHKADLRRTDFGNAVLEQALLDEATYDPTQHRWPENYIPPPSIQLSTVVGPYNGWPPSP